jgi:hypothetical protein
MEDSVNKQKISDSDITTELKAIISNNNKEKFRESEDTRNFYNNLKRELTVPLELYHKPMTM